MPRKNLTSAHSRAAPPGAASPRDARLHRERTNRLSSPRGARTPLVLAGLVLATLTFSLPGPAAAYRTAADLPEFDDEATIAWPTREVPFHVHTAMPAGLDRAAALAAIEAAAATWNAVDCTDVQLVFAGFTDEPPVAGDDVNTIAFVLSDWTAMGLDADAAATTDVRYASRTDETRIIEADLLLNADAFGWVLDGRASGARDVQSVVTHELGHVLGLLHPCELAGEDGAGPCLSEHAQSALHPLYSVRQRAVSADEVAGLCALYPTTCSGSCTPPPEPLCTTDAECPETSWCSAGACRPRGTHADRCTADDECSDVCSDAGWCTSECSDTGDCPAWSACRAGRCEFDGDGYGEHCTRGRDCASGVCITDLAGFADGYCSRPCGDACPAGERCAVIESIEVCAPPSSGGCSAGGSAPAGSIFLASLALAIRRRRGHS